MRLLHIINVRWFNAAAWYALNLAWTQKLSGHDVIIVSIKNSPVIENAKKLNIETEESDFNSNNPFRLCNAVKCFFSLLKNFNPHIVNCYRGEFFFVPSIRRLFIRNPAIIRFRGDIRIPKKGEINTILHRAGSDLIITSAKFIKDYYIEYLHIHSDKIRVLYGGIDTCKFRKDVVKRKMEREKLHYKDSDFVIAIVGRFDPVKGHNFLIDAIRDLHYYYEKKDIRLIIAGMDSVLKKETIERQVNKNKIGNITRFVPFREDIENIYNAADLVVIPSIGSEAICRVAMEAMACGTPVIGANTGVIPELIPESNVFKKADYKAIVKKIINYSDKVRVFSLDEFYEGYMNFVEPLVNL